jgi:hypothetical protein
MSILDSVLGQLGPDTIAKMAGQLGSNPQQTTSAIQAALPLLMGAMQRNVGQPGGADALHNAVVRDHQGVDFGALLGGLLGGGTAAPAAAAPAGGLGGLLGSVMGMMGGGGGGQNANPMLGMGSSILGHVLGGSQQTAANGVAQASGMSAGGSAQLMAMLAPLLMGAMGKATQSQGLNAGGLAGLLGSEMSKIGGGHAPGQSGGFMGGLLDADHDGDVDVSDLLSRGSMLMGLMGKR